MNSYMKEIHSDPFCWLRGNVIKMTQMRVPLGSVQVTQFKKKNKSTEGDKNSRILTCDITLSCRKDIESTTCL